MSPMFLFINNLYCWIYCSYKNHRIKTFKTQISFWNLKSLSFTCSYSLPYVFVCCTTRFHSLLLVVPVVVTRCTTRCHSLYHSLSLNVTLCTTRWYSLSFDVPHVCLLKNDPFILWLFHIFYSLAACFSHLVIRVMIELL